jgi:predicted amidohydrolase YtcJ
MRNTPTGRPFLSSVGGFTHCGTGTSTGRPQLNQLFPDKPVILWHRSFHELICNDEALKWFGLTEKDVKGKPERDWDKGHFWENGAAALVAKLAKVVCEPTRYAKGMTNFFGMCHLAGVTTVLDMGIGVFGDPTGEADLILKTAESTQAPCRAILTPTQFDFLTRKQKPAQAFEQAEEWAKKYKSRRVFLDKHFKLQVDGAIYGGLSQYGFPGYLDGHAGMWMAPPEVFFEYAEPFWKAGYQIHAHINGDLSADLFIDIIRRLQEIKPRFDHRATLEHFAFTTEDQCRQLKELGILVSANSYYHYILSDIYADTYLGADRGHYMCRHGSLAKLGVPFTFHSDCPMAPLSPLTLAWCAANRVSINGNHNGPEERISLQAALRAITIDAAWVLRRENQIGSIRAGKMADFAVLEQNPFEVGEKGLKDIPIWGTVFEGEVHPVKK